MAKAEGKRFKMEPVSKINTAVLEVFDFPDTDQYITSTTEEFGAVCPFSGLPDLAKVCIEYFPEGKKCIELKSLKYYLTSFRNVGLYQEGVTKRIYNDLQKILKTNSLRVTTKYYPRGGFTTVASEGQMPGPLPFKAGDSW